ncbi:MAG: hypothetical protein IPK16_12995 [Anaerolineales bacterium]|nr:hypothetical protein [Anaerolineales bacterium]
MRPRLADTAHIIVVNHALLLADLASGGRIIPAYDHLIVDETHRLEEAATDQLTYRVEWPYVQALLRRIGLEGELMAQLHRAATNIRAGELLTALPKVAAGARRAGVALADFAERLAALPQSW